MNTNSAVISDCGTYRYRLSRRGDLFSVRESKLLYILVNPSTADHEVDDPTITRCTSFAKGFGFNGFSVANLYALRATDPEDLWKTNDPVGPENDQHLLDMAQAADTIICGWGEEAKIERVREVCHLLKDHNQKFRCLVRNKSGMPRHPLYVKGDQQLEAWGLGHISELK